jgi:hypothetical protein
VPPCAEVAETAVTVRVWPDSFGAPAVSFVVRVDAAKPSGVPSAVDWLSVFATGVSLTSVTVTLTVPMADFGSAPPLVVPLSVTV